ncbi:MAG TPA: NrfD/PsrC family molybdoenzyme membrane anchor subunit [Dehalococcoidia bacterium]|nr:NrfD/PsrC family molybdoenzyme membrane anchor subunit [Dehalococcoidia bacterium]
MKLYNWMVAYTPQTAWIERRGIFIWLSLYSGVLGGGAYLVSMLFNSLAGMFISWLIVLVVKGGLHIAHAEKPLRLWRMILRPQTSWISRGLLLTLVMIVFGAVQLAFSWWAPGTAGVTVFKILAGMAAFGVMLYGGFTMNYINGIPIWNAAAVPLLFILWGLYAGMALVLAVNAGSTYTAMAAGVNVIVALVLLVVAIIYLWTETYRGATARQSVRELMWGSLALLLGIVSLFIGIIIPLIISSFYYSTGTSISQSLITFMVVCQIAGGLAFTYAILKAGLYNPMLPPRL